MRNLENMEMKVHQLVSSAKRPDDSVRNSRSVHLVGRMTLDVFSLLNPLTRTMVQRGVSQTVIVCDDPAFNHLLSQFPAEVKVVKIQASWNPLTVSRAQLRALVAEYSVEPVDTCHFHGFIPSAIGAWAHRFVGIRSRLYLSPHGSRLFRLSLPLGTAMLNLLSYTFRGAVVLPVASNSEEARRVTCMSPGAVKIVECPVDDSFFTADRSEASRPLVVSGAGMMDDMAASRFSQLAVLYWEEKRKVDFAWLGPVSAVGAARLKAAGVQVFAKADPAQRAAVLSRAWIFVSLCVGDGFPALLAEAMASGVASIAWNRVHSSQYVRHGQTGFVAEDESVALECMGNLLHSVTLRHELGNRARSDAGARFSRHTFETKMLNVYRHLNASASNPQLEAAQP